VIFVSLEENKAIIQRWFDAMNKKNIALLDGFVGPDFFDHAHQLRGLDKYKQFTNMFSTGFPDCYEAIKDTIAEGDKVWVLLELSGTHTGMYRRLAPTGKKVTAKVVNIFRIVDGMIVEEWEVSDGLDGYIQLAVVKYTEEAKKLFPEDVL
jgi:C-1 hydroxylase